MSDVVAYEFMGITLCPACALASTNLGMTIAGALTVPTMEDAIASLALSQIERGVDINTPVAVTEPKQEKCDGLCGTTFENTTERNDSK